MEGESLEQKKLKRDLAREALERTEAAARTLGDFKKVVKLWNKLDRNKYRRDRYWEVGRPNAEMLHWDKRNASDEKGKLKYGLDTVIPPPLEHQWWRQLLRGDFLDALHDCPYEMHELTSIEMVSDSLKTLNEKQMEVLHCLAIRQYSPQKTAAIRRQSDRNIRKVYRTMLKKLQKKLFEQLRPLYEKPMPLTVIQARFVIRYAADHRISLDESRRKAYDGNMFWLDSDYYKEARDESTV